MTREQYITNYLDNSGIKHRNRGYLYLVTMIEIGLENFEFRETNKIMPIYEETAFRYKTTLSCVERSIRYSLRGQRVANKEFIFRAIDILCYETRSINEINELSLGLRQRSL